MEKLINDITELMKKERIYQPEYSLQIEIIAQILMKCRAIYQQMLDKDYEPVKVAISREGHEKQYINNYEILFMRYIELLQKSLRSLGLNAEIKPQKTNDAIVDFIGSVLRK